jgi:hypothetical protein
MYYLICVADTHHLFCRSREAFPFRMKCEYIFPRNIGTGITHPIRTADVSSSVTGYEDIQTGAVTLRRFPSTVLFETRCLTGHL